MIEFVNAEVGHAKAIVLGMRTQEIKEYELVGDKPEVAITKTLGTSSASWTAMVDGQVACMWGIKQESLMGGAHIWLVTTPLVNKYWIRFLRESKRVIRECLGEYNYLYGYVDDKYETSKRWMEWLGFESTMKTDIGKMSIIRYEMRTQDGH